MDLTNAQWKVLAPLIPIKERLDGRGRPPRDAREVLNAILWVLRTGAPWHDLPHRYPPYQTCHRRYQQWVRAGLMEKLVRALAQDLERRGKIDMRECFIDGSFSSAKKGVQGLVRQNAGKAVKSWQLQTLLVFLSPYPLEVLSHMKSA